MKVTVELTISLHPKKDVKETLSHVARKLTTAKESIKVLFPEKGKVILQFWMPDKSQYKVVGDIDNEIEFSCWEFCRESTIFFENDRKRKPRSRRRNA